MIQMISGVTRVGDRTYSVGDGAFTLDSDMEKRLISAGVARYVESAAVYDLDGSNSVSNAGQDETLPDAESVTEDAEMPETAADSEDNAASDAELQRENFYDRDYLTAQTNARLKEIAEELDIDTSAMRKKADYVEAILQRQAADSGEAA